VADCRGGELGDEPVAVEALERERCDQLGVCSVAIELGERRPTIGAALNP
jgi:hypothetical protein